MDNGAKEAAMSPAEFAEALIIGMNLFVFGTFLAWRLLGPGRHRQEKPEPMAGDETQTTH
jgi:hypothetical protein